MSSENRDQITELKFTVRFSDCDEYGRLKLSHLFQFMEEAALADAERNGFGLWQMIKAGYTSAITRMKIRINPTPLMGEMLGVSTWTKEIYKDKVVLKDYSVTDIQGRELAEGTSSWILVNLKTGFAENPSHSPYPFPVIEGKSAMSEMLQVLPMGEDPKLVYTERARNSDLDLNHHVNHCRYVEWIMDCLEKQEIRDRGIRSLQLNFVNQVPLDARVDIIRFKNTNHHTVFFGMNADMEKSPTANRCHFQARVGFRD